MKKLAIFSIYFLLPFSTYANPVLGLAGDILECKEYFSNTVLKYNSDHDAYQEEISGFDISIRGERIPLNRVFASGSVYSQKGNVTVVVSTELTNKTDWVYFTEMYNEDTNESIKIDCRVK